MRKELEKMFDKKFGIKGHTFNFICWEKSLPDEVKQFIFDTIIPEVIKEILPCDKDVFEYVKNKSKQNFGITL